MGRSVFEEGALDDLLRRVDALAVDTLPAWGKLDATRMLAHVRSVAELAKPDPTVTPPPRKLFQRLMAAAFTGPVPFPKNVKAPARFTPECDPEEFEAQLGALRAELAAMRAAGPEALGGVHPVFGLLSGEQWGRLIFKHSVYHLNQFRL